jgi:hypothetical protein
LTLSSLLSLPLLPSLKEGEGVTFPGLFLVRTAALAQLMAAVRGSAAPLVLAALAAVLATVSEAEAASVDRAVAAPEEFSLQHLPNLALPPNKWSAVPDRKLSKVKMLLYLFDTVIFMVKSISMGD